MSVDDGAVTEFTFEIVKLLPTSAGVARRWGRLHCADGTGPAAGDCVSRPAARHEPPRLDRDEMKVAHDCSEAVENFRAAECPRTVAKRAFDIFDSSVLCV